MIRTVLGDIAPENLGFCQCHEHLYIHKGKSFDVNSSLCIDTPDLTLQELQAFRDAGGQAVVDAQPVGCGRDASVLRWLSQQSGVNIIASTGFHKLCFYPQHHWIFSKSAEKLSELFIKELTVGMSSLCDDCEPTPSEQNPMAGQIKVALDANGITQEYLPLFTGAAMAAKHTGAPVMLHVEQGANPMQALDFFDRHGIKARQLIFCHLDRAVGDLAVHIALAKAGAFLEYDTIGRYKYHSDAKEIEIISTLCVAGCADSLLMSLDVTSARLLSYKGEIGLCYILQQFLPLLTQKGIDWRNFFYANPQNAMQIKFK